MKSSPTREYSFVALDLETTGLDPKQNRIIEVGAVKYIDGKRAEDFASFVNPRLLIPERITKITGIDDTMVEGAPGVEEVLPGLFEFIGDLPILGHNITFDYGFLCQNAANMKLEFAARGIDTHRIAKALLPDLESRSLESLCGCYHIVEEPRHRAFSDAAAAARLYDCLWEELLAQGQTEEKLFLSSPLYYAVKKDTPITPKQAAFLTSLIRRHRIAYDKEIESLTKSQASREIDIILSTYGNGAKGIY